MKFLKNESTSQGQLFENIKLLKLEQAAQYLGFSESYLRRLKAKGEIPYVPIGRRGVRFNIASLDAWIERREIK